MIKYGDDVTVNYKIEEFLARGGMGEVRLATDNGFYGSVVLKTITAHAIADKELRNRLKRESRILSRLNHPNIVKIIHADFNHEPPYYIMEYCKGGDLCSHMKTDSYEPFMSMFLQALGGMLYAHKQGVIHRDLKPHNLLIDSKGVCKVSDFGLGMFIARDSTTITSSDIGMGTPYYMSPEQIRNAKHVDHRSDIYSLGIILTEKMCGATPIRRQYIVKSIMDRFQSISEVTAQKLVHIMNKASAHYPDDRYQSIDEFIKSVQDLKEPRSPTLPTFDITEFKRVFTSVSPKELHVLQDIIDGRIVDATYRGQDTDELWNTLQSLVKMNLVSGREYMGLHLMVIQSVE